MLNLLLVVEVLGTTKHWEFDSVPEAMAAYSRAMASGASFAELTEVFEDTLKCVPNPRVHKVYYKPVVRKRRR